MTDQTDRPALRDRIAEIRSRHAALAGRDWEAKPHQHPADGCRCLSCYDDPTGWLVDHPSALDCEERVAAEINDFGRNRASCDAGPLLTYEEADALAHAAEDIAFLLDQADAVLSVLPVPADRAAVLREAADGFDRHAQQLLNDIGGKAVFVAKALRDQAAVWSEAAETLRRLADETQQPEAQPRRGDAFEAWLKAQRSEFEQGDSVWPIIDYLLDNYRLHADTGTPLGEHVCEGRVVGDCECLEQPAAAAQQPKEA